MNKELCASILDMFTTYTIKSGCFIIFQAIHTVLHNTDIDPLVDIRVMQDCYAVSKLFEAVLVSLFGDSLQSNDLQFGFKRNSSCYHAIFTFNESVRCFIVWP